MKHLLNKYREWRERRNIIDPSVAAALFIAVMALAVSAGVMRWTWLIMDEQIELRKEYNQLRGDFEQIKTQYEFWSEQIQKERQELIKK